MGRAQRRARRQRRPTHAAGVPPRPYPQTPNDPPRATEPAVPAFGSDAHARAFGEYLRTGNVVAALETNVGQSGGYLAPPQFVADVVTTMTAASWFRALARVNPPTNAPSVTRPRRTAESSPFVWAAELDPTTPDAALKLGEFTLRPHFYMGEFEGGVGLIAAGTLAEDFVRFEIADNASKAEERAFVAGDGVNKPIGLFTPSESSIGLDRDYPFSPASFPAFFAAKMTLKAAYLRSPSLRWITNPAALKVIASLLTATGEPLWEPSEDPAIPSMLAGTPVELSDAAPVGSGAAGAYVSGDYFAVVGDLKQYDVQDNGEIGVKRFDGGGYSRCGKVGFFVRRKVDGCARVPETFVRLRVA